MGERDREGRQGRMWVWAPGCWTGSHPPRDEHEGSTRALSNSQKALGTRKYPAPFPEWGRTLCGTCFPERLTHIAWEFGGSSSFKLF